MASSCAHALTAGGVVPGDRVALYLHNCLEYLAVMLAAFKVRAVPINVNYRYKADELRSLLLDAAPKVVVYHDDFDARAAELQSDLDSVSAWFRVVASDSASPAPIGTVDFASTIATHSHARTFGARSGSDEYVLYTGGTTGDPKGVVWHHEDLFFAALGGATNGMSPITTPEEIADRCQYSRARVVTTCPFMHGTAQWMALTTLLTGGCVIVDPLHHLDADAVLALVDRERATHVVIVGDAFGRPLADALERSELELDDLRAVISGGAILSPTVKAAIVDALPGVVVVDSYGASETGGQGQTVAAPGSDVSNTTFAIGDDTDILDDDLRPAPVGVVGRVARRGHVPFAYHNDPARSAATFPVVDGVRWAIPGDHGVREADGRITLLGRGSTSINTGGEKVYPGEVESTLKSHPAVYDAIVVGVPDDRWGERVAAVVQWRPGHHGDLDVLQAHTRRTLADYKIPRVLCSVEQIVRSPSGKPDYRWAHSVLEQHHSAS